MKEFERPKKTLILADGEKPSLAIFKYFYSKKETLIVLDGAASWVLEQKIVPDLVIGDMDSFLNKPQGLIIHQDFDQETNDLEKALGYCVKNGLREITILGAFGHRIDHFLTNIAVLARFAHLNIAMVSDDQIAFICPLNGISLSLPKGSYISLFPIGESVGPVLTKGLKYPLQNEILSITTRLGTLNRMEKDEALIQCENGSLLVIAPFCPRFL